MQPPSPNYPNYIFIFAIEQRSWIFTLYENTEAI